MVKPLAAFTAADFTLHERQGGRGSADFREPTILCDLIGTCQGSASARLGSTFVLAGVRAVLEVPARTKPDAGELQVKVEVTSLASATRHIVDSRDFSNTLTHQLQEQLCTASFLDPTSLCLQPGKHCWHIIVDVRVLNDDGGLLDACLLAASFALKSVQVPDFHVDPVSQTLVERQGAGQTQLIPLQVHALPLSFSFGVDTDKLIVDPTSDEEQRLPSCLTVCINSDGLCTGVECQGCTEVTPQMLSEALTVARARFQYIMQTVSVR